MSIRILVLTKRHYMGKDLLVDHFGRFWEYPSVCARQGHTVAGICANYYPGRNDPHTNSRQKNDELPPRLHWESFDTGVFRDPGFIRYWIHLEKATRKFLPDVIVAGSDALQVILGWRLSKKFRCPFIADLSDNYESYPATRIPGILPLFRNAVRQSSGVACISEPLLRYVVDEYRFDGPTIVVENGVDKGLFLPVDQSGARAMLGLDTGATLIGTAGALARSRDIHVLISGFLRMCRDDPKLNLLLAGRLDRFTRIPEHPRIHYFGHLEQHKIPLVLNSLDTGIVCNRDSPFGRFCFPQKLYEMLACRVPPVAAAVGTVEELFRDYPNCRYQPGNVDSLVKAIRGQLDRPVVPDLPIPDWSDLGRKLAGFLESVVREHPPEASGGKL